MAEVTTADLVKLIGTPFLSDKSQAPCDKYLEQGYEKAFYERMAPLYLHKFRYEGWSSDLEERFCLVRDREKMTLKVLSDLADNLNNWDEAGYSIFKSIKPYPAIPNDTDVLIFGGKNKFESALAHLYECGYIFHEWAPMQTTLYDPRGKGKIGKGKKGGTYYIDVYSDISTDYFLYINKNSLVPYIENRELNGTIIRNVRKEVELAIILFHNIFPERTFQLEHFYMPLYHLKDESFDINIFIKFAEEQRLGYAIATNLTIVEYIHNKVFGFVPDKICQMLDKWHRNEFELNRFRKMGEETPYMFSPRTFWMTFIHKIKDKAALKSLFVQGLHMLNPVFFMDVMTSLKNRFSEKGTYHLE
jgi:hypothetical protein